MCELGARGRKHGAYSCQNAMACGRVLVVDLEGRVGKTYVVCEPVVLYAVNVRLHHCIPISPLPFSIAYWRASGALTSHVIIYPH
jgi:hypothetical protein